MMLHRSQRTILPRKLASLGLALLLPLAVRTEEARITAVLSSPDPVAGVTKVRVLGTASPGARVTHLSIFPDHTAHSFILTSDSAGVYRGGLFVLEELGTYRDVVTDEVTGASATLSYGGTGDFGLTVDSPDQEIKTGEEAKFILTVTSRNRFGGVVVPQANASTAIPGAIFTWSTPRLRVKPGGSALAILRIRTLIETPAGTYRIDVSGSSGSVAHSLDPGLSLAVDPPPPGTITAVFSETHPIVGSTMVTITGKASPGQLVVDTSTFPDGIAHQFVVAVTGRGTYTDGPFQLHQLGTYHDVMLDGYTGAKTEITYLGEGDFSAAVDHASATVAPGTAAQFQVTFKSIGGFGGAVTPAVPDLSRIPGASTAWSAPAVTVRPGDMVAAGLTIKTSPDTPPGTYALTLQGTNGSVTHAVEPQVSLTVR
jgi:hypothetical protein